MLENSRELPLLAVAGGQPAFPQGPPEWPLRDVLVHAALNAALADGSWGSYETKHADRLVAALQSLFSVKHVYPVCSGTFATELALRMLQIGSGDEVILAAYDFPGNFRAIEAVGAKPVLVDIDPESWSLDPRELEKAASPAVKAVIVSHLHGALAPLPEIMRIAQQQAWLVIEDACQAPGARVADRVAGTWGDIGTLSFGGSKLLTAGRGGAVLTQSPQLAQRAKVWCEQGNHAFPLSELQAAVLVPQVEQLAVRNDRREQAVQLLVRRFQELTASFPHIALRPVKLAAGNQHPAYYKLGWQVVASGNVSTLSALRERIATAARAEGIALDPGFRGFAQRSESRCRKVGSLEHARRAAAGTLVLHHPILLEPAAMLEKLALTLAAIARYFTQDFIP